jgi:LysR family transcriptional regulator, glycine cleavage system transcriptional activator
MTVTGDVLIPVYMPGSRTRHVDGHSDPFKGMTLLEDDTSRIGGSRDQSWASWYARNGYDLPRGCRRIVFSDAGLMVEAARNGVGVALARRSLVADHLTAGDVMKHEGPPLESLGQTWLVQRRAGNRSIASQRVVKWLLDTVSADHA